MNVLLNNIKNISEEEANTNTQKFEYVLDFGAAAVLLNYSIN